MTYHVGKIVPPYKRLSPGSVTYDPAKPDIRRPARCGNVLILIFVVVFLGWGGLVYLDGGAVAPLGRLDDRLLAHAPPLARMPSPTADRRGNAG